MIVERMLRKLEPLIPDRVHRWRQIRETADADLKALLDREILLRGHRLLGDAQGKILLSVPSEKKANGEIHLGTVMYDAPKWPAGITRSELLQNMAIFGRSGAGKTNVAFHLLKQLAQKRIPWLFLDWKRSARHLLPHLDTAVKLYTPGRSLSPFPFNPFMTPPGLEAEVYAHQVIDAMADTYTLGDGARSILQRAYSRCLTDAVDAPSVHALIAHVEELSLKERASGWRISALRALESVVAAGIIGADREAQDTFAKELLGQCSIVELDALSQNGKAFLISTLCLWLYYVKLTAREREQLTFVIFVEEAHHVLHGQQRARESLMEMLLRQCREIGIAIIVIDQHPHLISPAVLGNTYTSICLNLKDPRDVNRAAAISLVDDEEKRCFGRLPVGQGVVKLQDRWTKPFLVRMPLLDVNKGAVTDDVLRQYLAGSGRSRLREGVFAGVRRIRMGDSVPSEVEWRFLEDVMTHSDDGVKARYQRLGVSIDKGNRLKDGLLRSGWLQSAVVPVGRSRKVVLGLSPGARGRLGIIGSGVGRESLAHAYWKRFYAQHFEKLGYKVELEAPRKGGRVDVLATNASERVGIEIETGKSDVVSNVKNCLRSRYSRVIVMATDESAFAKIEKQLATEGLLIPGRVLMSLRDDLVRRQLDDAGVGV